MQKKYKVEIYATFTRKVWSDSEEEAKTRAESEVFETKINWEKDKEGNYNDLITGYKIIK
jgi:hypothetical protein